MTGPIGLHGGGEYLAGDEPFLDALLARRPTRRRPRALANGGSTSRHASGRRRHPDRRSCRPRRAGACPIGRRRRASRAFERRAERRRPAGPRRGRPGRRRRVRASDPADRRAPSRRRPDPPARAAIRTSFPRSWPGPPRSRRSARAWRARCRDRGRERRRDGPRRVDLDAERRDPRPRASSAGLARRPALRRDPADVLAGRRSTRSRRAGSAISASTSGPA